MRDNFQIDEEKTVATEKRTSKQKEMLKKMARKTNVYNAKTAEKRMPVLYS